VPKEKKMQKKKDSTYPVRNFFVPTILITLILVFSNHVAAAQVPQKILYQGRLDVLGTPYEGLVDISFKL